MNIAWTIYDSCVFSREKTDNASPTCTMDRIGVYLCLSIGFNVKYLSLTNAQLSFRFLFLQLECHD